MGHGAATYSAQIDPDTGNPIDRLRFLVGDTDVDNAYLCDTELSGLLTEHGSPDRAAPYAADGIAALLARKVDLSTGKVRKSLSQLFAHYTALAKRLRAKNGKLALPYGGGILKTDRETDRADTSLVQPAFDRGQFSNPEAPSDPGSTYCPETDDY